MRLIGIDHVLVASDDLEIAMQEWRNLGFEAAYGGEHPGHGTHNALVPFANGFYVEMIAIVDEALAAEFPQTKRLAAALERENRLFSYALDSDDLERDLEALRAQGQAMSGPLIGGRTRPDGQALAWKTGHFPDARLPFLIEDVTPRASRIPPPATGLGTHLGLESIEILASGEDFPRLYRTLFGADAEGGVRFGRGAVSIHESDEDTIAALIFTTGDIGLVLRAWDEHGVHYQVEGSAEGPEATLETPFGFPIIIRQRRAG